MKRIIYLAAISGMFCACGNDETNTKNNAATENKTTLCNELQIMGLKGKIKTIIARTYQAKKVGEEWVIADTATYKNDISMFLQDGYLQKGESYSYNNGKKEISSSMIIEYTTDHKSSETKTYDNANKLQSVASMSYTTDSTLETTIKNESGNISFSSRVIIDKNCRRKQTIATMHKENGNPDFTMTTTYSYNTEGEMNKATIIAQDANNNTTREMTTISTPMIIEKDEAGNPVKIITTMQTDMAAAEALIIINNYEYY